MTTMWPNVGQEYCNTKRLPKMATHLIQESMKLDHAIFERIVTDADGSIEHLKYNPQARVRSAANTNRTPVPNSSVDGPWIIILDDFVSDTEPAALIKITTWSAYPSSHTNIVSRLP